MWYSYMVVPVVVTDGDLNADNAWSGWMVTKVKKYSYGFILAISLPVHHECMPVCIYITYVPLHSMYVCTNM